MQLANVPGRHGFTSIIPAYETVMVAVMLSAFTNDISKRKPSGNNVGNVDVGFDAPGLVFTQGKPFDA